MTDIEDLLERAADRGSRLAHPPAFALLRRRRRRRKAARWSAATLCVASATAAIASGLLGQRPPSDSVVAAPQPTAAVSAEPLPSIAAGQVFVPANFRGGMVFAPDAVPAGDLLASYTTSNGPHVIAGQRRGGLVCIASFEPSDAADAYGAAAVCEPATGGIRSTKPEELDVIGSSAGRSGEAPDRVALEGSAPAGTRTIVVSAPDREPVRLQVTDAGPAYGHRAWFGTEWSTSNTTVEALGVDGRLLDSTKLDMSMPTAPR